MGADLRDFYQSKHFQDFFKLSKQSLVLKADFPVFTVIAVSDNCLEITKNIRELVIDRPLFEAYPGSKNDALDQKLVSESFQRVIDTGKSDVLPVFKYEIYGEDQLPQTLFWSNINEPIFDEKGNVAYIINTTENVTDKMLIASIMEKNMALEQQVAIQGAALTDREQMFHNLIEQAPVAIALMNGPKFVLEVCNEKVLEIWGRTAAQVLGLPVFDALPETSGQGFEELLNSVYQTGKRIVIDEMPVTLKRKGQVETAWVNFIYEAIRDRTGIITSVIVVSTEVTEQVRNRKNLEILLEEKTALVEQVELLSKQRKDDFISIASHELRTPITSLKASLQFMNRLKSESGSVTLSKMIELASGSMDKISNLIDDLLIAARMDNQIMELNITSFTFGSLIENLAQHFGLNKKINLIIEADLDLLIHADQQRIEQVLINFLNNAVKYAAASSEIRLIAEQVSSEEIKICVRDSGPGIIKEKIKYLFERYYQTDHSQTQYAGMGVGLYISAEIIKRHGGKIGVVSELGKGSTFWFTLPIQI